MEDRADRVADAINERYLDQAEQSYGSSQLAKVPAGPRHRSGTARRPGGRNPRPRRRRGARRPLHGRSPGDQVHPRGPGNARPLRPGPRRGHQDVVPGLGLHAGRTAPAPSGRTGAASRRSTTRCSPRSTTGSTSPSATSTRRRGQRATRSPSSRPRSPTRSPRARPASRRRTAPLQALERGRRTPGPDCHRAGQHHLGDHHPAESARSALEGGGFAQDAQGVHRLEETAEGVVVTVGSGTYEFASDAVLGMLATRTTPGGARHAARRPRRHPTAARRLSHDIDRARGHPGRHRRPDGRRVPRGGRQLAAEALGRLHVLGNHIDGLEEDGQRPVRRRRATPAPGAGARRASTLVTGLDGHVELQQVGDAIAGSSFNAGVVVENGSNRRLTQVAAALRAPTAGGCDPGHVTQHGRARPDGHRALHGDGAADAVPRRGRDGWECSPPFATAPGCGSRRSLPVSVHSPVTIGTRRCRACSTSSTPGPTCHRGGQPVQEAVQVSLAVEDAPEGWSGTQPAVVRSRPGRLAPSGAVQRTPESAPGGDIVVLSLVRRRRSGARPYVGLRPRRGLRADPAGEACLSYDFSCCTTSSRVPMAGGR